MPLFCQGLLFLGKKVAVSSKAALVYFCCCFRHSERSFHERCKATQHNTTSYISTATSTQIKNRLSFLPANDAGEQKSMKKERKHRTNAQMCCRISTLIRNRRSREK